MAVEDLLLTGAALVLGALRQTALTHDESAPTSVGQVRRLEGHQVVSAVLFGPVTSVFLELVLADAPVRLSTRRKVAKGSGCLCWVVLLELRSHVP